MNLAWLQWRGVWLLLSAPRLSYGALSGVSTALPDVCESRTINYITHTLPQQCLRTSWSSPVTPSEAGQIPAGEGTATITAGPEATQQDGTIRSNTSKPADGAKETTEATKTDDGTDNPTDEEELAASAFPSFEEWKEMMLRKSGQDPDNVKRQRGREPQRERESVPAQVDIDSLGDDGEIALEFDALSDKVSEMADKAAREVRSPSQADQGTSGDQPQQQQVMYVDGTYRSKDAGKTCKERFSFTSFDAGATILKTSPGAKSARSILVENKDSYMLMECHTKNKFVIVELSDDILVDTVVLANYEFFSSMIRRFRVSVSARYPVKLDKWVDLGTFEARNARDIQAFLVPHPQIYTKYIRIEFLTHYGTEYYCPVSLLRVHGTRMLDTWKESEPSVDDDMDETIDAGPQEVQQDEPAGEEVTVAVSEDPVPVSVPAQPVQTEARLVDVGMCPWQPSFGSPLFNATCPVLSKPMDPDSPASPAKTDYYNSSMTPEPVVGPAKRPLKSTTTTVNSPIQQASSLSKESAKQSTAVNASSHSPSPSGASSDGTAANANTSGSQPRSGAQRANSTDAPQAANSKHGNGATPTASRNKTNSASSAPAASPTVQESFFKAVTKRLQHLESNTSLSLQYIEDQSRFLKEALQRMERKQLGRVDAFLDSLNKTVLTELRNVRIQYDQIWQGTVLALETQREQNEREIVALSSRLNVLADEVVFQKRMAILQSVLLLSCLVLVIFARSFSATPSHDLTALNPQGTLSAPALISPASPRRFFARSRGDDSPPSSMQVPGPAARTMSSASARRHPLARSQSYDDGRDKTLPLTPTSEYAPEGTPLIHVDDADEIPFFANAIPADDSEGAEYASITTPPRFASRTDGEDESAPESDSVHSTPQVGDRERSPGADRTEQIVESRLRHSHAVKSQLGRTSSIKPLPALPESPG